MLLIPSCRGALAGISDGDGAIGGCSGRADGDVGRDAAFAGKGERIGVDGSTMEANASLRTIVRRDSGETYRAMLTRMAQESGIETPTAEDLARFDRKRKGKTLSNVDWKSPTDPEAKIAKMKTGRRIWNLQPSTRSISAPASSWRRRLSLRCPCNFFLPHRACPGDRRRSTAKSRQVCHCGMN
jgi:hypothetical protein